MIVQEPFASVGSPVTLNIAEAIYVACSLEIAFDCASKTYISLGTSGRAASITIVAEPGCTNRLRAKVVVMISKALVAILAFNRILDFSIANDSNKALVGD